MCAGVEGKNNALTTVIDRWTRVDRVRVGPLRGLSFIDCPEVIGNLEDLGEYKADVELCGVPFELHRRERYIRRR